MRKLLARSFALPIPATRNPAAAASGSRLNILILAIALTAGGITAEVRAQKSPADTVAGFRVPEGWEVKVFASEPRITNPTAIDVDTRGRVWICEGQWYRGAAKDPPADKIKVLEDTDGDGRADKVTVFADGLTVPMSVCVAGAGVYVGESPNLWKFEDRDGDLKADPGSKKALLTGFKGVNSDHGLHGLVVGPDDKLYMTHGDAGFDVTGPDGSRMTSRWGAMMRCNLDGSGVEAIATDFRNPYELAVDSFGNIWCSDNDQDGLKAVRICWILDGGDYGWQGHPLPGRNPDGSYDPVNHWRVGIPGYVPFALITGFGSPCGIAFYEHYLLGSAYRNQLIHADSGPREIRCYHIEPVGAGFKARQENIVTSDDNYFRPSDVCVGPDGAIYIADWYDRDVGGHEYNNPDQGRIYRLAPRGDPPARIGKPGPYGNIADALEALGNPNLATQFLARQALFQAMDSDAALLKLLRGQDKVLKARALWVLDQVGASGAIDDALNDDNPRFRALAVRILRRHKPRPLDRILSRVNDEDAEVRREVLLALRGQTGPKARNALIALIRSWDGRDRFYLEAINVAAGRQGPEIFTEIGGYEPEKFNERMIKLLQIFKPELAVELLAKHLKDSELPVPTARTAVEALGWMDEPEAGRTVALVLANGKAAVEVRQLAARRIRDRMENEWKELIGSKELETAARTALAEPELRADGLQLIGRGRIASLAEPVTALVTGDADAATRVAAIAALARLNTPTARQAIVKQIREPVADVQAAALKALVSMRAFEELEALLADADFSEPLKLDAVRQLTEHSDGCLFLLTMMDEDKLATPLKVLVIRRGARHADVNVRQLYAKYTKDETRPATIAQLDPKKVLAMKGDARHGKNLFRESAANCSTCHRIGQDGEDIGPDLTLIGRKYGQDAILAQIMQPAAAIAPEFVPYIVETTPQGYMLGFLLENTADKVVIKTQNGARETIPRKEVVAIQKQEGTLMPDLLLESFGEQDVADLLAYLSGLKTAPEAIKEWLVVGPFPDPDQAGVEKSYPPEAKLDPAAEFPVGDGQVLSWKRYKTAVLDERTVTEISKLGPTKKATGVYCLFTNLDSPQQQPARLHVRCSTSVVILLNGKSIFSRRQRKVADFSAEVKAPLQSGRNALLVKVEYIDGEPRLQCDLEAQEPLNLTVE